jgi:hypothetical protein
MINIPVNTKKMTDGSWVCFTTYNGIDKFFDGDISVVNKMAEWLKGEPVNIIWNEPVIYLPSIKDNYKFQRPKIDNL